VTAALAILAELHHRGASVRVVGDRLRYRPVWAVAPELRERMNEHREELLALVEHFEERAAIREFDGGLSRAEAERLALEDVVAAARRAS